MIEASRLRSRFGFLAIHGGGLEQMTDVIAERAADAAGASVYLLRHPEGYPHHLPSARYLAAASARLAEFLDHVDVVVSVHGYGRIGRSTQLLAGGGNRALAQHLARHIDVPGYQVVTDPTPSPPNCGPASDNPSTGSAAAAPSSNSPRGWGSAHAASCPVTTASPATSLLVRVWWPPAHAWPG